MHAPSGSGIPVAVEVQAVVGAHDQTPVLAIPHLVRTTRQRVGEGTTVGGECRARIDDAEPIVRRGQLAYRRRERARVVGRELRRRDRGRGRPEHGRASRAGDGENGAQVVEIVREPRGRADRRERTGAVAHARGAGVPGELEHEHTRSMLEQVGGDRSPEVAERGQGKGADRRRDPGPSGELRQRTRLAPGARASHRRTRSLSPRPPLGAGPWSEPEPGPEPAAGPGPVKPGPPPR